MILKIVKRPPFGYRFNKVGNLVHFGENSLLENQVCTVTIIEDLEITWPHHYYYYNNKQGTIYRAECF